MSPVVVVYLLFARLVGTRPLQPLSLVTRVLDTQDTGPFLWYIERLEYIYTRYFKSLYPSIIRAMRLDHQAFVEDPAFLGVPGVEYKTYAWADEKTAQRILE
eukprot:scaffold4200_cov124-Isochrysis_galbana.AAC.3